MIHLGGKFQVSRSPRSGFKILMSQLVSQSVSDKNDFSYLTKLCSLVGLSMRIDMPKGTSSNMEYCKYIGPIVVELKGIRK